MKPKLNHWCVIVWDDAPPSVELCVKVKGELGLSASKNTKYGTFLNPNRADLLETVNYDQVKAVLPLRIDLPSLYSDAIDELEKMSGKTPEALAEGLRQSIKEL